MLTLLMLAMLGELAVPVGAGALTLGLGIYAVRRLRRRRLRAGALKHLLSPR